jgi:co-chaperonin GroES (HSP10)
MKLKALHNKILCHYIQKGQQTLASGIILTNDDGREGGIRPRWMQVYAVGPDVKDIKEGQWVMVEHGRWTHGMTMRDDDNKEFTLWGAEEEAVLLVSDNEPTVERSPTSAN